MNSTELRHRLEGTLEEDVARHYGLTLARDAPGGSHRHLYEALALSVRDRLVARWRETQQRLQAERPRRVSYLSMEFLIGRSLHNAILNLDIEDEVRDALQQHHSSLEEVESEEMDAGLGNGGLGRLAACFLDSCASQGLPVTGYGIRYQYGMFRQRIQDGYQVEHPDGWLRHGNPWEFEMPEHTRRICFGGRTEHFQDNEGRHRVCWVDTYDVLAVPCDMPVPGYRNDVVNTLRLWKAEATEEFNLDEFNAGSYTDAVQARTRAEQITMVLYPNDQSEQGKELRLRQQYFLASASLQDVLQQWDDLHGTDFAGFAELQRLPAQRYPPDPRHSGNDATAPGRLWPGVEQRLGNHPQQHGLHQSHAAAGGARNLVSGPVREAAAAPAGDYPRDQRPLSQPRRRPLAGRCRAPAPHVDYRGGSRAAGAHGLSGHCRQLLGEWRCRPAHPPADQRPVPGFLRVLAPALQQQDQRRDPAALAGALQSRSQAAA